MPFTTNRKVSSWECHWKKRQIAADESSSVWKIGSWDYNLKIRQVLQQMRDMQTGNWNHWRKRCQVWMWQSKTQVTADRSSCHCFFFNNIPSKTRCRANITTLDISVFLFHPCIVCTTCITLGLTRACSHANRVNGVNEHTFHVGHPGVFIETGKAWMCHSKC